MTQGDAPKEGDKTTVASSRQPEASGIVELDIDRSAGSPVIEEQNPSGDSETSSLAKETHQPKAGLRKVVDYLGPVGLVVIAGLSAFFSYRANNIAADANLLAKEVSAATIAQKDEANDLAATSVAKAEEAIETSRGANELAEEANNLAREANLVAARALEQSAVDARPILKYLDIDSPLWIWEDESRDQIYITAAMDNQSNIDAVVNRIEVAPSPESELTARQYYPLSTNNIIPRRQTEAIVALFDRGPDCEWFFRAKTSKISIYFEGTEEVLISNEFETIDVRGIADVCFGTESG